MGSCIIRENIVFNITYTVMQSFTICTGEMAYIKPEREFKKGSGKDIIDDAVMSNKKKAVCRIYTS